MDIDNPQQNNRPIIFVVHSLGGLVCEQVKICSNHRRMLKRLTKFEALLICRGAAEVYMQKVLDCTSGIVFMGTPHVGADLAKWASIFTSLSAVVRRNARELVDVLKPGSEVLAALQQEFHTMLDARREALKPRIKIFCFFEEIPVMGAKVIPHRCSLGVLVEI